MASGTLPVREYASAAELRRHAAEVRARLFAPRVVVPSLTQKPTAPKAWAKPQVKQISLVAPETVTLKSFKNPSLHPVRGMMEMVSFITGISDNDLRSHRRTADVVKARQILYFVCKTYTPYSLPDIGRRTGGKDHTSVLHGVRRVQDAMDFLNIEACDNSVVMASQLWAADWPKWAR
jgi:hypothetical protein